MVRWLILSAPTAVLAVTCSNQDIFSLLGVAMQPSWPNCTSALGQPPGTLAQLVQFKSAAQLSELCSTPTCVENINTAYSSMPNCTTSDGLELHEATAFTSAVLCSTLPASLLTHNGGTCTSLDRTVVSFIMGQRPVSAACLGEIGANASTIASVLPVNALSPVCHAPACLADIGAAYSQLPECTLPDGTKSRAAIQTALDSFCNLPVPSAGRRREGHHGWLLLLPILLFSDLY
ncbi:hypothetical protein ACHHYP_20023 [Achlya hypogyna]|uniref:Secreted protein n=1 Tax=Achlya hypogyna TaxID=1202772 RepID=A0A1V9ZUD6_ACHHY|nr:hypothetical protein ACHHYP_20023 [Achlya hypogyna]